MNKTVSIKFTQQSKMTTAETKIVYEGTSEELSDSFIKEQCLIEGRQLQDDAQREAASLTMKYNR